MRKIIYISVLLLFFSGTASAQNTIIYQDTALLQQHEGIAAPAAVDTFAETTVTDEVVQTGDEEKVDTVLYPNNLNLPYDSIKNWKNLKEYAYAQYLDSLLKNRERKELKSTKKSSPGLLNSILSSGIIQFLFWAVVIAFVLFVIYRLFLADGVFQRKSKSLKKDEDEAAEEQITGESDFDALIRVAIQNGNYRQAVRYQYLRTLHTLADKKIIELAPDKTNFQYVREIASPGHQNEFAALTLHYEYVWYGEFNIERNIYQKIENNFISLNQKLYRIS